jgi:putative transposase
MLAAALEAEVDAYLAELAGERDERGRRLVVRNGHAQPRRVMTGAGPIEVSAPRVNDKRTDPVTGERKRFRSAILPPWCRKSPKVAEVLPLLYLHGLSSGDFVPALEQFLGSAAGLSAAAITRLTTQWTEDYRAVTTRDLSGVDDVYVWADGIHVNVRLEQDKLCLLVIVGVRADGPRNWSRWPTATGSRPAPGVTCYATAPHLVALVRAGTTCINGQLVERPAATVAA